MDVADIDLHVWPDPVADQLNIQGLRPGTTVVLLDVLGRTVRTRQVVGSTMQVPITGMPNGYYVLRTSDGRSRKFVK